MRLSPGLPTLQRLECVVRPLAGYQRKDQKGTGRAQISGSHSVQQTPHPGSSSGKAPGIVSRQIGHFREARGVGAGVVEGEQTQLRGRRLPDEAPVAQRLLRFPVSSIFKTL